MSSSAKATLNFSIDLTGRLLARRLRVKQALIVAASLTSRLDNASAAAPADLQGRFESFAARITQDVEAVAHAHRPAPDTPTPQPPAELLALVSAEVAASPKALNHDIDKRVASLMRATEAHIHRGPAHPKGAAAALIQSACFSDGLRFLKLSGPLQWLAVQERLEGAPPEVVAAYQTLGMDDVLAEVQALNAWFGRLLNITEAPDDDDEPTNPSAALRASALDRLHATFADLLALSHVAWPSDQESASKARLALLSPYLSAVQAVSEDIGQRMRAASEQRAEINN
jgi:hypothetical protein